MVQAAANIPTDKAPAAAAIPLQLAEAYFALQNPATLNIRYSQAVKVHLPQHNRNYCRLHAILIDNNSTLLIILQQFVVAAVVAYECGYTEDTLRQELKQTTAGMTASDFAKVSACLLQSLQLAPMLIWCPIIYACSTFC